MALEVVALFIVVLAVTFGATTIFGVKKTMIGVAALTVILPFQATWFQPKYA